MLPEIIGKSLDVDPQKTALIYKEQRMTYAELDVRVQMIANTLLKNGYNGGHKLAIIAKNSINYIALYLACRRTNNIAVMINYKLPTHLQESLIEQSDASRVYRDADLENIELTAGDISYTCDVDKPCLFLFTSGTTGEPKAVILTNGNRQASTLHIHRVDTFAATNPRIVATPLYHMNGIANVETVLDSGGTLIVMSEFNASEYIKNVIRYRVGRLAIIPSMLSQVVKDPDIGKYDFGFVRVIITATSPLTQNLYDRAKTVFYNAKVRSRYGLTEFGNAFGPAPEGLEEPPLSCGYPLKTIDYKIVDGILHLRSNSMSRQYHQMDISKVVDGWLNTGDRFRMDDSGFYFYLGRADDMYKVGGEQVYPLEIESVLDSLPGILQSCVVMLPDEIKGFKPHAFCVGEFDETHVKELLLEHLPRFKIPRNIWKIDTMPLAGVGKIDRNLLTEKAKELL